MAQLRHIGVLGMRWGHRKRSKNNAKVAKTGVGTFQPTYQYRDSNGTLISRYGPGKYGGPKGDNKRPINNKKSDDAFKSDVERRSKNIPAAKSFIKEIKQQKVSDVLHKTGQNAVVAAKAFATVYAAIVVTNFVVDKLMFVSGAYNKL